MSDLGEEIGARFGFRRRCAWCGVVLRGWQLNLCQRCGFAARSQMHGPPFIEASRWNLPPDSWPWPMSRVRGRVAAWKLSFVRKDRRRDLDA